MKPKHLRVLLGILAIAVVMMGSLEGKTRKGDKLLRDGKIAEAKGDWDKALALYQQAFDEDPTDTGYMIAMRKARFETGQKHVDAGKKLRADGKLEEAMAEFQKAVVIDPSSSIALQELKRTRSMIEGQSQSGAKPEDRGLTPSERARRESDERVASILAPPDLKP